MKKKKIECNHFREGRPNCSMEDRDAKCPILHPENYIAIEPWTLVISNDGNVGIATGEESYPEETTVITRKFPKGCPVEKEDLIPLVELPPSLGKVLMPEEALSMFTGKIIIELAKKVWTLEKKLKIDT